MLVQCTKCGEKIEKKQSYEYQGNLFCESCYMDILSPPKACDPWAVHSAQTFLKGKDKLSTLTPLQLKIVGYIKGKGEATVEEMTENLNLTEQELRREFAVLRHMEILRASKKEDKIFYTLFLKSSYAFIGGDMESNKPECAKCGIKNKICISPEGQSPDNCPTLYRNETIEKANEEYNKPDILKFAREASVQEAECYINRGVKPYVLHPTKPRVQEVCEFAQKMGYKKLGIAFCGGLHREALSFTQILETQGFEVVSVVCKAGRTPKELIGIREEDKVRIGEFESMCSPIAQANILNEEKTDFNILVGLCVGHDSLFLKYSKAYCTVLVAKDRVLSHNPCAALYTTGSYYARMLRKGF